MNVLIRIAVDNAIAYHDQETFEDTGAEIIDIDDDRHITLEVDHTDVALLYDVWHHRDISEMHGTPVVHELVEIERVHSARWGGYKITNGMDVADFFEEHGLA
tara:strand:+ start:135 stop:443 length:309 start_codon:yes stop_codon:yes gene_type:complete